MYKYRVFFKQTGTQAANYMLTLEKLVPLMTPARVGEKLILPQHMKAMWGMPDWILKQGVWRIQHVIHQVKGVAVEEADILILVPTSDPLMNP